MIGLTAAVVILAGAMKILATLDWDGIEKGLVGVAGLVAILVSAAKLMNTESKSITKFAGQMILMSAAVAALAVVPEITEIIGKGIVQLAAVLGEYAPQLAESFLRLISESLSSLAKYTPEIVDSLLIFAIGLINGVAEHAPELIAAATHLIDSVIKGIFSALNGLDAKNLLIGVLAVSGLTGLIYALAGITSLIPSAMAGLAGVGAVLAELVGILAVVGGIAQIPGLEWLVTEGGDFLQKIGTAIGQFTGGIIGGVAEGVISTLPRIGNDLSMFMLNIQTFVEGAKQIDSSLLESIQTLSATILILAGTNVVDAIASFFSGNDHFSRFSKQLTTFGEGMKQYGEAVSGLNTRDIENSAAAAEAIVKVVDVLPSSGGVAQFFSGKHDLSRFGKALIPFGEGMKQYGEAVSGIDTGSILTSVLAANGIVAVANAIPADGGLWQLLSGSKDLDQFANKLIPFAYSMKYYGGDGAHISYLPWNRENHFH